MICKHCNAEIAEKALICYRCGNATTEPRIAPPARGRRRSNAPRTVIVLATVIAFVLALIAAWYFGLIAP